MDVVACDNVKRLWFMHCDWNLYFHTKQQLLFMASTQYEGDNIFVEIMVDIPSPNWNTWKA